MYPMQSLAVIAPIIFIILMIAFPIIGFFMGWKRAVFWGAGNLIFYIIGLVIWILAGKAMGEAISPLLQKSISALKNTDMSKIATSVVAPVFFIIVMFFGNIILIINYFAWFTRVAQIRREDKERIGPEPIGKPIAWDNFFRRMIGAISLPALLLPSTFSFTQAIFYATTSKATRAKNKLANNLYNGLNNANNTFKWLSYYKDTAADFDALFAGLNFTKTKITYINPVTQQEEEATVDIALKNTLSDGIGGIFEAVRDSQQSTFEASIGDSVNNLAFSWNSIMGEANNLVTPIFESKNATALIKDIIGIDEDPVEVPKQDFDKIFGNGVDGAPSYFDQMIEKYNEGHYNKGGQEVDFEEINRIKISEDAFNNVKNTLSGYYKTDDLSPSQKEVFEKRVDQMLELILEKK